MWGTLVLIVLPLLLVLHILCSRVLLLLLLPCLVLLLLLLLVVVVPGQLLPLGWRLLLLSSMHRLLLL
jgi:hypothetical protein